MKLNKKKFLFVLGASTMAFVLILLVIALTSPSVEFKKPCFKTTLYSLEICPGSPEYTKYSQLPEHLVYALVVSEDASFFGHSGFDWREIYESFKKNISKGRFARGGSTITQQLAKNVFLSAEKSLIRKLREVFVARSIERKLSKPKILELYFNVVEFGPKIYGIKKASRFYFNTLPEYLTPVQSAFLISLLPSPIKYSKEYIKQGTYSDFNRKIMKLILLRLEAREKISRASYKLYLRALDNGFQNVELQEQFESGVYADDDVVVDADNEEDLGSDDSTEEFKDTNFDEEVSE